MSRLAATGKARKNTPAEFWAQLENAFTTHDLVDDFHALRVRWHELTNRYSFKGSQDAERLFKSLASQAAAGLPSKTGKEPWELWLDYLRLYTPFYQIQNETLVRYSKQGLGETLKEGFEPVVSGAVSSGVISESHYTEFPRGCKPGAEFENVDFWSTTGEIRYAFAASASGCRVLSGMPSDAGQYHTATTPELKILREKMLSEAQQRWLPISKPKIPFSWVYESPDVHVQQSEAYRWKSGQLAADSTVTMRIEKALREPWPPRKPAKDSTEIDD